MTTTNDTDAGGERKGLSSYAEYDGYGMPSLCSCWGCSWHTLGPSDLCWKCLALGCLGGNHSDPDEIRCLAEMNHPPCPTCRSTLYVKRVGRAWICRGCEGEPDPLEET